MVAPARDRKPSTTRPRRIVAVVAWVTGAMSALPPQSLATVPRASADYARADASERSQSAARRS
jgi:hypothetical protein